MKQKKRKTYRLNSEGQYLYTQTRKLLQACRADVERELIPLIKRYAPDMVEGTQDGWIDNITDVLDRLKDKWLNSTRTFVNIASKFVNIGYSMTEQREKIHYDNYIVISFSPIWGHIYYNICSRCY